MDYVPFIVVSLYYLFGGGPIRANETVNYDWSWHDYIATPQGGPTCNCYTPKTLQVTYDLPYPESVTYSGACMNGWCEQTFSGTPPFSVESVTIGIPSGYCLTQIDYEFDGVPGGISCSGSDQCPEGVYFPCGVGNYTPTFVPCD